MRPRAAALRSETDVGPVLYLLSFLPTYVHWEVSELVRRGIKVHLVLSAEYARGTMWDGITGFRRAAAGDLQVTTLDYYLWLALPDRQLFRRGVPVLLPLLLREPRLLRLAQRCWRESSFRHLLAAAWLARHLANQRIKRIHGHFVGDVAQVGMLLAEILGIPFTVTAHANDIFAPPDRLLFDRLLERAAQIFTISEFNRQYLAQCGGARVRDRIRVAHLGVDLNALPARASHRHTHFTLISTASGLSEKKGLRFLIEACAILKQRVMRFDCTIVGSDPNGTTRSQVRSLVSAAGLDGDVTLVGAVPWKELTERVAAADAFVLPCVQTARGEMDGIPVALIEAMGIGVPVVSTPVSGIPELIENGATGFLVPPADSHALADVLQHIANHPEKAAQVGLRGRETVQERFSLSRYVDQLIGFWNMDAPTLQDAG